MRLGDEVNAERLQLKQENWLLKAVRRERDELQERLQKEDLPPDYHVVRDRTLNRLKVGRQSTVGKALDTFVKELEKEKR